MLSFLSIFGNKIILYCRRRLKNLFNKQTTRKKMKHRKKSNRRSWWRRKEEGTNTLCHSHVDPFKNSTSQPLTFQKILPDFSSGQVFEEKFWKSDNGFCRCCCCYWRSLLIQYYRFSVTWPISFVSFSQVLSCNCCIEVLMTSLD